MNFRETLLTPVSGAAAKRHVRAWLARERRANRADLAIKLPPESRTAGYAQLLAALGRAAKEHGMTPALWREVALVRPQPMECYLRHFWFRIAVLEIELGMIADDPHEVAR